MINVLLYINEAAVAFAIATFLIVSVKSYRSNKKQHFKLEYLLAKGISASAIPTGLALLVCAFKPDLLQNMSGFNIHIATAGCALLYISIKGIIDENDAEEVKKPIQQTLDAPPD